jgi:hypothetical protein
MGVEKSGREREPGRGGGRETERGVRHSTMGTEFCLTGTRGQPCTPGVDGSLRCHSQLDVESGWARERAHPCRTRLVGSASEVDECAPALKFFVPQIPTHSSFKLWKRQGGRLWINTMANGRWNGAARAVTRCWQVGHSTTLICSHAASTGRHSAGCPHTHSGKFSHARKIRVGT